MEDLLACLNGTKKCNETEVMNFEVSQVHPAMIFHGLIMSVGALIGLCVNCIVVALIIARRRLRSVGNLYILNRAICDILSQLTTPFLITTIANQSFIFGLVMCQILSMVIQLSIYASAMFLWFMAIDCYICGRQKFHSATFRFSLFKVLTSVQWVVCAIFAIPIYFLTVYNEVGAVATCIEGPLFYHFSTMVRITCIEVVFVIPFILTWIFVWLSFPAKTSTPAPPPEGDTEEESEEDATQPRRLIVALAVLYTLCQLPYWVTQLIYVLSPMSIHLFYVMVSLLDINTAINPILYLIYNRDLKQEFMILLPSRATTTVPLERLQ